MYLTTLDFAVVIAYFAGLAGMGYFFSRREDTKENYFLGDRNLPWLAVGISVMATLISTLTFLAMPGEAISRGTGYFYSTLAIIPVIPVVNRIIIPALMRLPMTTVYEYFEKRFGLSARCLGAIVFVVTRLLWIGLIIYTASFAVHKMTGWNPYLTILLVGIMTTLYTTAGGISAVVWTDFAQGLLLLGGALFVPFFIAFQTDSGPAAWWNVFSQAGRDDVPLFSWDLTTRTTIIGIIIYNFTWNICTHGADQVAAQRYLSTTSVAAARRSVWVYAITSTLLVLMLMVVGISLFYFNFHQSTLPLQDFSSQIIKDADGVFPTFIAKELPSGISGLMLAALLAAAMSSLSSGINSICSVIVTDFLERFSKSPRTHDSLTMKVTSGLVGLIGIAVALVVGVVRETNEWNLIDTMQRLNELFVAPLGALFLVGIIFRRVGSAAALLGFVAGSLAGVLISFSRPLFHMPSPVASMWIQPASLVVSLLVSFVTSYLFAAPSPSQLEALNARAVDDNSSS